MHGDMSVEAVSVDSDEATFAQIHGIRGIHFAGFTGQRRMTMQLLCTNSDITKEVYGGLKRHFFGDRIATH